LACAKALAAEGVQVTSVSCSEHELQEAAKQIGASTGVAAKWIAADISQATEKQAEAAACSDIDILVTDMALSTADRMALTGFVACVSREVAQHNVAINNLLPGTIMTGRLQELGAVAEKMIASVPAGRAGTPSEFGDACAFLCSDAAGFIVGQNLSIDGALVRATI